MVKRNRTPDLVVPQGHWQKIKNAPPVRKGWHRVYRYKPEVLTAAINLREVFICDQPTFGVRTCTHYFDVPPFDGE